MILGRASLIQIPRFVLRFSFILSLTVRHPMDLEFVILTVLVIVAAYLLIQWRDSASAGVPKYSVVRAGTYPKNPTDDVRGYPAGRQGAPFRARVPGDFETFKSDDDMVPIAPLGIINPAESLARLQAEEASKELSELQFIRQQQQQASVALLPSELDSSVAALVDRNLLLNSGPVAGQDARTGLRNGSFDLRRSPQVQRNEAVSIWNISTTDSEGYRRPLE